MNTLFSNPLVIVGGLVLLGLIVWFFVRNTPRAPTETDPGLGWTEPKPVENDADEALVFAATEVQVEPLPTIDAAVEAALVEVTTPAPAPVEATAKPKRTAKRSNAATTEAAPAPVETVVAPISGTATPVKKTRAKKTTPTT